MTLADHAARAWDGTVLVHLGHAEGGEIGMAVWLVTVERGERVRLQYRDHRGLQDCGAGDVVLLSETVAFAAEQAQPGDVIVLPSGFVLIRQRSPIVPC